MVLTLAATILCIEGLCHVCQILAMMVVINRSFQLIFQVRLLTFLTVANDTYLKLGSSRWFLL